MKFRLGNVSRIPRISNLRVSNVSQREMKVWGILFSLINLLYIQLLKRGLCNMYWAERFENELELRIVGFVGQNAKVKKTWSVNFNISISHSGVTKAQNFLV